MTSRFRSLRWRGTIQFGAVICLLASLTIQADPIIYSLSSTGSGRLGTNLFSATSFTITSTADTLDITNTSARIFHVPDITATVSVFGLGSAMFTIPTINVANQRNSQGLSGAGISAPNQQLAILFANNPAFANYDLSYSVGPFTGSPAFNPSALFETSVGAFSLTSVSDVTFQAIVVPEPCIPVLFIVGLMLSASKFGSKGLLLCLRENSTNSADSRDTTGTNASRFYRVVQP
jgi:hypothetical protein